VQQAFALQSLTVFLPLSSQTPNPTFTLSISRHESVPGDRGKNSISKII
jgi:hypothetical protein